MSGDWWHTDSTDDWSDGTDPFLPSAPVFLLERLMCMPLRIMEALASNQSPATRYLKADSRGRERQAFIDTYMVNSTTTLTFLGTASVVPEVGRDTASVLINQKVLVDTG